MPGLCGVVQQPASHADDTLGIMLERMRRFAWQQSRRVDVEGVALGHVSVTPSNGSGQSGLASSRGLRLAFDGELYGMGMTDAGTLADQVTTRLEDEGLAWFAGARGSFTAAVWEPSAARLSLVADRFGTRPLYWTQSGSCFFFASEISALLALNHVSDAPDEEGLAQFLSFGQCLGETTLHKGIRLVPAASLVTFDARMGTVSTASYGQAPRRAALREDDEWVDAIEAAAVSAVERCCGGGSSLGLSLSGGLDARTILGLAPPGTRMTCVSLGIPGSIDHRAAASLAGLAGQPHHPLMLADDFLPRFEPLLRQMVDLTDGQYLDQGIVLTTLPVFRELGIQTLLRGHAGELMHMSKAYAFSVDGPALRLRTSADLDDWLWSHLTDYMIGGVDDEAFASPFGKRLRDMARAALRRQVELWDDIEPASQRIWHLFVAERLRRETALSLQLFRNYVEVRVPFWDPELVDLLLAAPTHLKVGDELQTRMLQRHRPDFLAVVNANTGARMGAGELSRRAAWMRMKVLASLGVAGYQPYERLGLWLSRELRGLVGTLLLSTESVAGQLFDRVALTRLISQHESRKKNHTFLLMALMTLEMARQGAAQRRPTAAGAAR